MIILNKNHDDPFEKLKVLIKPYPRAIIYQPKGLSIKMLQTAIIIKSSVAWCQVCLKKLILKKLSAHQATSKLPLVPGSRLYLSAEPFNCTLTQLQIDEPFRLLSAAPARQVHTHLSRAYISGLPFDRWQRHRLDIIIVGPNHTRCEHKHSTSNIRNEAYTYLILGTTA